MSKATNSVGWISSGLDWGCKNLRFAYACLFGLRTKVAYILSVLSGIDARLSLGRRIRERQFSANRVFQVSSGARPLSLISLMSMRSNALGIDLDVQRLELLAAKDARCVPWVLSSTVVRFGRVVQSDRSGPFTRETAATPGGRT